jgi:hypothetical protein
MAIPDSFYTNIIRSFYGLQNFEIEIKNALFNKSFWMLFEDESSFFKLNVFFFNLFVQEVRNQ